MSIKTDDYELNEKKLKYLKLQILEIEKNNIVTKKDSELMAKELRKLIEKEVDKN